MKTLDNGFLCNPSPTCAKYMMRLEKINSPRINNLEKENRKDLKIVINKIKKYI